MELKNDVNDWKPIKATNNNETNTDNRCLSRPKNLHIVHTLFYNVTVTFFVNRHGRFMRQRSGEYQRSVVNVVLLKGGNIE